jgi:HD-like signal output (HDOD) protein
MYFQVVNEIQSPSASAQSVGKLVERDPVITAKLLQLSNSVAFGRQQQVADAVEAILYLGFETTKSLILLAHTFSYFDHFRLATFHPEYLWQHSVAVGDRARRIAEVEGGGEEMAGQAYTAGLLHDLGKLVLAINLPDLFVQAVYAATKSQFPLWQIETELFGASHSDVGAALLGIWGLPTNILEAVALHHSPARFLHRGFCSLTAVHAADVLAHEAQPSVHGVVAPKMDVDYLSALNLNPQVEKWRESCKAPLCE